LQHGIAGGYYLAFFFGSFVQTAGRLCRSYIRPLFLPAVPATKGATDKKAPAQEPPATLAKMLYDLCGIVVAVTLTNYAAGAFMLLSVRSSLLAWSRLLWYGHWMVGLCLIFFYAGGRSWLAGIQARRVQNTKGSVPPLRSEDSSRNFVVPPIDSAARHLEKRLG